MFEVSAEPEPVWVFLATLISQIAPEPKHNFQTTHYTHVTIKQTIIKHILPNNNQDVDIVATTNWHGTTNASASALHQFHGIALPLHALEQCTLIVVVKSHV